MICKLETQEGWWYTQFILSSPENQESQWHKSLFKVRRWDVPAEAMRQEKRGEFPLPLLFVLFRPSTDWMMAAHTGKGHLLYWVHHSNANLIQKAHHRHTQKQCLLWAHHSQSSQHIQLTIRTRSGRFGGVQFEISWVWSTLGKYQIGSWNQICNF